MTGRPRGLGPLWRCTECGRKFANRNQTHACGRHSLAAHFKGKSPTIRTLFDDFVACLRELGPVTILPEKTRIAFQTRMSFAQLTPRRNWLDGHLVLARRVDDPVFRRIESISPKNHVHHFRITGAEHLDGSLRRYMKEAYAVGEQKHLSIDIEKS